MTSNGAFHYLHPPLHLELPQGILVGVRNREQKEALMAANRPRKVEVRRQLRKCPNCSYRDGFHLMFRKEREGGLAAYLICPQCSKSYDIGLKIPRAEERQR